MNAPHLDRLVASLRVSLGPADPAPAGRGRAVAALLAAYAREERDWQPFALYDEASYTRNQLARNAGFELLLLCWGEGQESPIHNHEGQDCWMAVLEGRLEEVRYPMPPPGHVGPLHQGESHVYGLGQVAYIRDEMGLHLVRPVGGAAVSLHLYATPYAECNVYCPETGKITRKRMVDHSVRGRLVQSL